MGLHSAGHWEPGGQITTAENGREDTKSMDQQLLPEKGGARPWVEGVSRTPRS